MIIEKHECINDTIDCCLEWLVKNKRIKDYKITKIIPENKKSPTHNKLTIVLNDGTSFTIQSDLWTEPLGTFLR